MISGIWSKCGSEERISKFLVFPKWAIKISVMGSVIPFTLRLLARMAAPSQSFEVIYK